MGFPFGPAELPLIGPLPAPACLTSVKHVPCPTGRQEWGNRAGRHPGSSGSGAPACAASSTSPRCAGPARRHAAGDALDAHASLLRRRFCHRLTSSAISSMEKPRSRARLMKRSVDLRLGVLAVAAVGAAPRAAAGPATRSAAPSWPTRPTAARLRRCSPWGGNRCPSSGGDRVAFFGDGVARALARLVGLDVDLAGGAVDLHLGAGSTDLTAWVTVRRQWPQVMPCTWKVWFMVMSFRVWQGGREEHPPCHHGKVKRTGDKTPFAVRLICVKA